MEQPLIDYLAMPTSTTYLNLDFVKVNFLKIDTNTLNILTSIKYYKFYAGVA